MIALEYGVRFMLADGTAVEFAYGNPADRDRMSRIARAFGYRPTHHNRVARCRGCRPYTVGGGRRIEWRVVANGGERIQAARLGWL